MGKNLIQQRRGKGTPKYRAPSHRYAGEVKHPIGEEIGTVKDVLHSAGHSAPVMEISTSGGQTVLEFAPENIRVGQEIRIGQAVPVTEGNVLSLKEIPEGTLIHNIELRPGDGGKLVRAAGTFARIVSKTDTKIVIKLPSRKEKGFLPDCRASIGIVAGAGRLEKPFLKAGTMSKKMAVRNKLYPVVSGISMNAVDHPFGGSSSHSKGRPTQAARSAPPGRKVGKIAPRRTGRRKL